MKTKKWLNELKELIIIAIAIMPYAFAVNRILVPHAVVGGGMAGLCEIIYFASGNVMPIWATNLLVNALLLTIAVFTIGWKLCIRTIYGVFWMTFWLKVIPVSAEPLITDPFMAVILAGLVCGVGLGIVFLNNGASGGTDIIAMIVNHYRNVPMGTVLFICDLVIISCAWLLPQVTKIEQLLFGLCFTFMCTTAVDWTMNRVRQSVQIFIFSTKYEEIAQAIMTKVPRGVTLLEGEGGYTKHPMKVVTCLARRNESNKIFHLVRDIDPDAFVSETQAAGVFGKGFDAIKKQ